MRGSRGRKAFLWTIHYIVIGFYVALALFPLYWLLKVSVTPNKLLYSEGVRMWPSQASLEHYVSVIRHTDFPLFFRNSVIVSAATAVFTTLAAAGMGYALSRYTFHGKIWLVGLMLVTQMFPLVMII